MLLKEFMKIIHPAEYIRIYKHGMIFKTFMAIVYSKNEYRYLDNEYIESIETETSTKKEKPAIRIILK